MTLLFLQYPLLAVLALLCAVLSGFCVRKKHLVLFLLTSFCVTGLVISALACLLPYRELLLLLLPSLLSAFFFQKRREVDE